MSDYLPKITIATVTYNAGKVLERTINSVEMQSYPEIEHLIVDGNSQDNTLELLHRYQERNSRALIRHEISAISEPDKGLYDAMNKALSMATGDYICFLNAGDKLHASDTISKVVGAAGHKVGVIYGLTDIVDEEGVFLRPRRLTPPNRLTWRSFRHGMLICHQAFFANIQLARETPYDCRYRFSADFDWCIRIMKKSQTCRMSLNNSGAVVADYLEEGLTTRNHKASLHERFRIMSRHYGWITTVAMHAWFIARTFLKK